jgi:hypothetical protein
MHLLEQPELSTEKRKLALPLISIVLVAQQQHDAQDALVTDEDDIESLFRGDGANVEPPGNKKQEQATSGSTLATINELLDSFRVEEKL